MILAITSLTLSASAGDHHAVDSLQGTVPGQLLSPPMELEGYSALHSSGQKVAKILYRSTSGIDGSATVVSGVVFVPKGNAPPRGWPIASIAHPTTGITSDCAPSAYPNVMGNLPEVVAFLSHGFVVVMSDDQGLGTPGPHPYLEPKTAAYNVIDAVRAARQAVPDTSDTWITYGFSQGGQAAWAANELSADYGNGLRLVGAVSISPPTDLRAAVDAMESGTLTTDQIVLLPLVLKGLQAAHPELNLDDYLHGVLAQRVAVFFACAGVNDDLKGAIAKSASPEDVKPVSKQAADKLRSWLEEYSLPIRHTDAPMLVAYGDADPIIPATWTASGIQSACALGDILDVHVVHGQGHNVQLRDSPANWTQARITGIPPRNSCAAVHPS